MAFKSSMMSTQKSTSTNHVISDDIPDAFIRNDLESVCAITLTWIPTSSSSLLQLEQDKSIIYTFKYIRGVLAAVC